MSGVCQADRISRDQVSPTFFEYCKNVLLTIPQVKDANITGSYICSDKQDFGDIDSTVLIDVSDKKYAKQLLIDAIEKLALESYRIIVPFEYKDKTKYYYNSGEMISVKTKQHNSTKTCQIDNIICLTQEEFKFKTKFLSLEAEVQGLILGLVKISDYLITTDYEWDLSSTSLRIRDLDGNVKFMTQDWNNVERTLLPLGISTRCSFTELIEVIKTLDERSIRRIKGLFKKMISVKSGEVGTPKGVRKMKVLSIVENL